MLLNPLGRLLQTLLSKLKGLLIARQPPVEPPVSLSHWVKPRKTSSTKRPNVTFLSGLLICVGEKDYPRRQRAAINQIVVHRCGVAKGLGNAVAEYRKKEKYSAGWYTGQLWPYHHYILPDGTIYECLPLTFVAPAALRSLNQSGVHVALEGDFRKSPPTPKQEASLKALCAWLKADLKRPLTIRGHTDTPDASSDPNKECPGRLLKLPK